MNELDFIKYLESNVKKGRGVVKGIGDDAAVLEYSRDKYLLFASDMIIEGVHFKAGEKGYNVGWKAAAVNISDIAAMGGVPKYITVSAGVDKINGIRYLKDVLKGAEDLCAKFGVAIAGGDTNLSDKTVVDVSIIGEVEKNKVILRNTAKIGDMIFVTGSLGGGRKRHLGFIPKIKESRLLNANFKVNSMIDISDGLMLDLTRICVSSGVGARIYENLIPLDPSARDLRDAISYGEDFELLFTVPVREAVRLIKYMGRAMNLFCTLIGEITQADKGVRLIGDDGKTKKVGPKGFIHFE